MKNIVESQQGVAAEGDVRSVVILGATGSIGRSTAEIISGANGAFRVEAIAGGRDPKALARLARNLGAKFAALADPRGYAELKDALAGSGIEPAAGDAAVVEAALRPADIVMGAIAGTAGVPPTFAALSAGRTVALANKECLVCAGAPFMRQAAASGTRLLPVDSEHNAIFQAMGDASLDTIEMITLTASGGPFRTWTSEAIANATPEQALNHPNWSMGPKITVDSAGLMNKGLEVIEAHYLFRNRGSAARYYRACAIRGAWSCRLHRRLGHRRSCGARHESSDRPLSFLSETEHDRRAPARLDRYGATYLRAPRF